MIIKTTGFLEKSIGFQQNYPKLQASSHFDSTSLSTLTSISEDRKYKKSNSGQPKTNLHFLRGIHRKLTIRKKIRKIKRVVCILFVYVLPIIGIFFGTICILTGYYINIQPLFISGCLLLIVILGLVLQSCFWNRSFPNKFKARDIAFNMPQEDSSNYDSQQDEKHESPIKMNEDNLIASPKNANEQCNAESPAHVHAKSPTVLGSLNNAQFRRLSMALNRATEELHAVRRINTFGESGMLNFARRLTMAPGFGDTMEGQCSHAGNGWIGGRIPHGLRRGLAWNETGASRFFASNYD